MKKLIITVLFTLLAAPAALAADRYISDDLFTFMHSGPNNTYRIIGSVNAGSKVQLIKTTEILATRKFVMTVVALVGYKASL